MIKQILLNKNRGKRSVDVESGLMVPLSAEERILPFDDISDVVNLKEIYDKEKDSSDLYRLIFTINPICSNVLFNTYTEVVYREGSDSCTMLTSATNTSIPKKACNTSALNQVQAIRDTEYSHPSICEGLVYHCGTDIFNNHILRNGGFVAVTKMGNGDKTVFNTIKDYNRDKDGKNVEYNTGSSKIPLHLYNADNLLTFKEAFRNRLVEDDGWFGFTNTSLIDIPNVKVNNDMVTVNKVMNNNKSCEFIDMFPDRSLFSFIPKVNKYRNRIEPNWDYCLTYPYRNEYTMFQKINGTESFTDFYGIRIVNVTEGVNESGIRSFFFETLINHNLNVSERVRLYFVKNNTLIKSSFKTKVSNIGDSTGLDKNRIFSVSQNDLDNDLYDELSDSKDSDGYFDIDLFFKKDTNQGECDYYFRIFRKIPNFATSTKNIHDMNNDVEDVISNCKKDYFKSENSKLSFSQNIYGDKSSQILFTDLIDLTRLVDNNGRKLSEIYLTIVKRNQGYKSWYSGTYKDNQTETVEFSRAFGKVTSGLNLGLNEKSFNYNVRRLHNITDALRSNNSVLRIPEQSLPIEENLSIKGWNDTSVNNLFYGDIVERNPDTCDETVLEKIYHRFNTAQRETSASTYGKLIYDVLLQDDNLDEFNYGSNNTNNGFTVAERTYGSEEGIKNVNLAPEGYYYQPHFKIKVNEVNETITEADTTLINFEKNSSYLASGASGATLTVTSPKNYDFKKFDVFLLYEKGNFNKNHHWGFLNAVRKTTEIDIRFETILKSMVASIWNGIKAGKYVLVKTNANIPSYAIPSQNMPYKFKWKELTKPSEVPSDSDMVNRPFTNGSHYIHNNINFYLRRQDPFGDYHLQYGVREDDDSSVTYNPLIDLTPYGDYKDINTYEYYSSENYNPCIV